ncbi:hypothetical protein V3851_00545 [Paenibacillus sp. M1]|uniref:Anti-sigma factor n=1 Tax=Paenibacillus haidiansis TaxID=1574488 RepID=A0ABU7VKM0_9BACL
MKETISGMTATQQELWKTYIRGELPPEQAEELDKLLQDDESAFRAYMQELIALEADLPALGNDRRFADGVLSLLPEQEAGRKAEAHRRRRHRPLLQYIIAAAVTFLLLSGGAFDVLSDGASAASNSKSRTMDTPLSHQLIKQAAQWVERTGETLNERRKDE